MNLLRSLSVRVMLALAAGLALGALAAAYVGDGAAQVINPIEALGGLWLNALRMTVVPLIFAVLVTGIARVSDAAATGKLAARAVVWFVGLMVVSAGFGLAFSHGLLALWPASPEGAEALRNAHAASPTAQTAPDFVAWLKGLAPSNPVKAAAEDAILPLVVFSVFLGFALTRLPDGKGRGLIEAIEALGEAMIVIVRWVLWAGPVGVFALALGVGLRAGAGAAGVLGHYIVVAASVSLGITVIAHALALIVGRVPPSLWFRATSPVMATAFATQSSLACLPAMVERSRDELGVPARVADLVLPLAVAVFRLSSPAANLTVCIFVAHVYGLHPSELQFVSAVLVAMAVAVGSVGLPGQVSFIVSVTPIAISLGLPIELLPILLAVEVAPDIFRTLGNVSGDMAVTAILAKGEPARQA